MPVEVLVQLLFWAGLLGGLAIGGALGAWQGFEVGGATAGLVIGICGLSASGYAMYTYWEFFQQPNAVEARVVSAERPEGGGSPVVTVRFTTRDGRAIETSDTGVVPTGPNGPLRAEDKVGVLYGNPASKVTVHAIRTSMIVGVVFGMFSTFALLVGLFFIAQAADMRAHARATSESVEMERPKPLAVRVVTIASNVVFVAAFAWLLFAPGDKLQSFGVSARFILVAGVGYAIAGLFTPGGQWISVMIPLIVGIVFGMFSGLIRIVT
jgi:hypothetical protein